MWVKLLIGFALLLVLINLFTALFHLMKGGQQHSEKTLRYLTIRLVISIFIFIALYVFAYLGYIQPHGLPQHHIKPEQATPQHTP